MGRNVGERKGTEATPTLLRPIEKIVAVLDGLHSAAFGKAGGLK
jgi:hypothetical protein